MKRNHAETVLTSIPYLIWMVVFTVIPFLLVTYFAFTDETGALTMANLSAVREYVAVIFRSIWLAFIQIAEYLPILPVPMPPTIFYSLSVRRQILR